MVNVTQGDRSLSSSGSRDSEKKRTCRGKAFGRSIFGKSRKAKFPNALPQSQVFFQVR